MFASAHWGALLGPSGVGGYSLRAPSRVHRAPPGRRGASAGVCRYCKHSINTEGGFCLRGAVLWGPLCYSPCVSHHLGCFLKSGGDLSISAAGFIPVLNPCAYCWSINICPCVPQVLLPLQAEKSLCVTFFNRRTNFIIFVTAFWFDSYGLAVCRGWGLVSSGGARHLGSSGAEQSRSEGVSGSS